MKRVLMALIRAYKKHVSPGLPRSCRFVPTCSEYALEAIETRGVVVGVLLSIYRVLRCNPFCKGGYDPVPQKRTSSWRRSA